MKEKINLPLFINGNDPLGFYVVANEVVAFDIIGNYNGNPRLAYYLIGKLVKNPRTRNKIPKTIVRHFDEYPGSVHVLSPCLCGNLEISNYNWCLATKMAIEEIHNKPTISFCDFAILETRRTRENIFVRKIREEITLTTSEAVILLGNICLSAWVDVITLQPTEDSNNYKALLRDKIDNAKTNEKITSDNSKIILFCYEYLEYLLGQLENKEITAETILKLSGAGVLAIMGKYDGVTRDFIRKKVVYLLENHSKLGVIEKITYLALLELSTFYPEHAELRLLKKEKRSLIEKLLLELQKPFPQAGEKCSKLEVIKEYKKNLL